VATPKAICFQCLGLGVLYSRSRVCWTLAAIRLQLESRAPPNSNCQIMVSETGNSGSKISVLLIAHSYPPVLGGSEVEAQQVSAELRKRGHRVHVLCAGEDPMPRVAEWVDPYGTPVRIFGSSAPLRWKGRVFAAGVAWWLIKKRRDFSIAYFLMQGLQVLIGVPVARLLGMGVVMKFSGGGEILRLRESRLGRLELLVLRSLAHRIMVLNDGMMEEAAGSGFDMRRMLWMPNPVDTDDFCPCGEDRRRELRRAMSLPPAARVVVFTGRLAPQKALPYLLGAFALVTRLHPEAILALVGDGPSRAELEGRVGELGLERNVRFVGMIDRTGVREWLQASDVFALISPLEGFSCALLEAMSAGLPSVVSEIPANTQLVDDEVHGLVTRFGDEQAIARAIERLVKDPSLCSRLGAAARTRILDNYSAEKVAQRYETLFRELLH
jgi:glycosyltransferase involved in cell wall biosynthesis